MQVIRASSALMLTSAGSALLGCESPNAFCVTKRARKRPGFAHDLCLHMPIGALAVGYVTS